MDRPNPKARALLLLALLPIFTALFIYSVTWAFVWDEGFHLVAAQLIAGGSRPYLDFCFPQTPLNAYINAAILLLFGDHWKPVHIAAAIYLCAAIWLVADFVQSRLPDPRWRTPCALAAAALFGLNTIVVQFGPSGQAYAISTLLAVAAFRAASSSKASSGPFFASLAGLCAGASAASTLLTAPVAMVLFLWFVLISPAGKRISRLSLFIAGCAVPFAPVAWLYVQGPRQTLFNVLQYQTLFRRTNWGDANLHDMDALTSWITSPPALLLIVLFAASLMFLFRSAASNVKREFILAAAIAAALILFISTAHPTFERYFCAAVPFAAMAASLGIYAAGTRLATPRHAWLSAGLVILLSVGSFARALFDEREDEHWSDYEAMATQIAKVAPLGSNLYADELIYFLLQRTPPEGMAFSYAQKLELPPDQAKLMHIVSLKTLKSQMQAGHFTALQTCRDSILDSFEPEKYFHRHTEPNDCDLFWDPLHPER